MNKNDYLILVQNQPELLEYQLPLLDHARVDLYIHIDKKAKKCRPESLKSLVKESKIFFINSTAVSYGSYTQIQCQFELMRQAAKQKYSYYHFLSDCDLPLRTQEHILDFFESHQGREFVNIYGKNFSDGMRRRFNYIKEAFDAGFRLFGRKSEKLEYPWSLSTKLNPETKISSDAGFQLQAGINACSITHDLVSLILLKEPWCEQYLSKMGGVCELFFQTILCNSMMKQNIYYHQYDNWSNATMRYIDYKQGNPYVWQKKDFDTLIRSPYLFASPVHLKGKDSVAKDIYDYVTEKQKK